MKKMKLKPVVNKNNGQINFSIKKSLLPKEYKSKLSSLKAIKINMEDFEW